MFGLKYIGIAALASQAFAAPSPKSKRQSANGTIVTDLNVISQYWGNQEKPTLSRND